MSTIKLDDLLRIPKLESGGTNWVVYSKRLKWAIDARSLLKHLDSSASPPVVPTPADPDKPTKDETALIATREADLVEWNKGEAIVKQLIASTIPDSLFIKLHSKPTALAIWTALSNEFENKSRMVSVDLRRRLQDQRANEKDDLRIFHYPSYYAREPFCHGTPSNR